MIAAIYSKRLGQNDCTQGSIMLIQALSKQNISTSLAKNQASWPESLKDIGTGLKWFQANQ